MIILYILFAVAYLEIVAIMLGLGRLLKKSIPNCLIIAAVWPISLPIIAALSITYIRKIATVSSSLGLLGGYPEE